MSVQLQRALPRQIIFCIDISREMGDSLAPSIDGSISQSLAYTRLETVLSLIRRYVAMNQLLAPNDTYGLISMMEYSFWMMDFTADAKMIDKHLDTLSPREQCADFDTTSLFKTIHEHAALNDANQFVHAIVFYGRTDVMPQPIAHQYGWIRSCTNFTFDLLFLHAPTRESAFCQDVYDYWISLEPTIVSSWFFEFARLGKSALTKAMAQLTAHPLQRGDQERMTDLVTKPPETIYLSD
ncbi:hypothetical protein BJV82DRAFT_575612 [Fennellomyces sp. T-0311]|nr:hypothetical protein BJV82DRAFT_575612 [Fennellomyces sp. T-0311]